MVKRYGRQVLDWWGHNIYWTSLEIFQQAIEKAGTLDQSKIKDILHNEKFETILGTTYFENQLLAKPCYSGQIGQWQNGEAEVIDAGSKRTAKPVYPKPPWPAPKSKKYRYPNPVRNCPDGLGGRLEYLVAKIPPAVAHKAIDPLFVRFESSGHDG